MKKKRGMALIMALYVTAIVFSLAAFFITDQFHKSKIVADSQDEKLALEAANMGLAYVVNYLGDVTHNWYDSLDIGYTSGGMLTKADSGSKIPYLGNELDIDPAKFGQSVTGNTSLLANVYTFSLADLITVSPVEKKSAGISGTLTLLYPKDNADVNNPQALSSVGLDVIATVEDAAGNTVASREIEWSGPRILNLAQVYQCWNCWDIPGAKPPNATDGTDNKNYIGNGYANNAGIAALSKNPGSSTDYSTNSLQSPYGTDQNGNITVGAYNAGYLPPAPVLNGAILAENNVTNGSGSAAGTINGPIAGKNVSIPLPSGEPWGTFDPASSGPAQNAPQAMSQAFAAAATDGACTDSSGIRTVFVVSSADVGDATSGSGQPHDVEFEGSPGQYQTQKPGFAVTDISLNPDGKVTVTQSGYYSGGTLYSKTFDPAKLTNHTLYVQGGNVRVHGDLQSAGLTVVANQAESWNGSTGADFKVTGLNGTTSSSLSNTSCVAPNPNIPQSENSILYAQRIDSSVGGTASAGVNYWIPNTPLPVINGNPPPSTGIPYDPNNPTAWQRSSTPCASGTPCLYDGQYYDGSGHVVGEHVDDVNGRPIVPICTSDSAGCTATKSVVDSNGNVTEMDYPDGKFEYTGNGQWTMQCTDSPCDSLLSNAMYAPPPQYNADGTPVKDASGYAGGNTFAGPTVVHLYDSSGNPVAIKTLAAYPGDENLAAYQNDPSTFEVFSSRQLADSEGNLTIAGDTIGNSLRLVAQNYVFVNDMMAQAKSGYPATQIQADVASFSKSMQWEGNVNTNGSATPQDYYMNGDYAAMNKGISDGYFTASGAFVSGKGYSYDGAPLMVPGTTQFVDPLTPNSGQTSWASGWRLNFTGFIYAPYAGVINVMDSSGNLAGYEYENVNLNRLFSGPTLSFPQFSFTNWQNLDFTAIYPTVFYQDLGAPHA